MIWEGVGGETERLPVPGGWLYRTRRCDLHEVLQYQGPPKTCVEGWHAPVFVPDARAPHVLASVGVES